VLCPRNPLNIGTAEQLAEKVPMQTRIVPQWLKPDSFCAGLSAQLEQCPTGATISFTSYEVMRCHKRVALCANPTSPTAGMWGTHISIFFYDRHERGVCKNLFILKRSRSLRYAQGSVGMTG
jgi:hypothetical protein